LYLSHYLICICCDWLEVITLVVVVEQSTEEPVNVV